MIKIKRLVLELSIQYLLETRNREEMFYLFLQ